ncbi:hypothetical protein Mapa_014599 [Marchantia paleacea]|nr:hypothetical protein Mapa_014599 [Marchantia paleacea]
MRVFLNNRLRHIFGHQFSYTSTPLRCPSVGITEPIIYEGTPFILPSLDSNMESASCQSSVLPSDLGSLGYTPLVSPC